ncbi:MAG: DinB family protein [Anaerolineae bacterium]|nr:DinB family protein [Anaerolineae bacterium]
MHPISILEYGQRQVVNAVKDLPDAAWDTPGVCGFWSVKQIIGHLIGWEHYFEEFIAPFAGKPIPTPHIDDYKVMDEDAYNDKYGTAAATRTSIDLMAEFQTVNERVMTLAKLISEDTWRQLGTLPWSDSNDLEDFVVYGYYGHKYEHAAQIVVFRDKLNQQTKA